MESLWVGIITALGAAVILPVLAWYDGHRKGVIKAKSDADEKAITVKEGVTIRAEGRERQAWEDGFNAGCAHYSGRLGKLERRNSALEVENVECQKLASRQAAAIDFLDQDRKQTHDELVNLGARKGPFLAMPVNFRPEADPDKTPVPNPERFHQNTAELKDKLAEQIVEQLKEEAKGVLPPEHPCI